MLQHFHILTLTHHQSDLKDIGRLVAAIDPDGNTRENLQRLKDRQGIDELFYVGTCNRVTLFFTTKQVVDRDFKVAILEEQANNSLLEAMIHYQGSEAISHLFAVASSIDSLVIGERQILGQLREAYEKCRQWGFTGDDLRVIFDRTVVAAKDVYAKTRIGEKSISIVSLAIRKMMARAPKKNVRILLIGAGQTNSLVAKFLRKYDYQNVTVFNRSPKRAHQLAASFKNGTGYALSELNEYTGGFDVIFVCTSATDPVINASNIGNLIGDEAAFDKLIIDLAVPNNVSEDVVENYAFNYVCVEDLRLLAKENMSFRTQEIQKARQHLYIHEEELRDLYRQRLLERALQDYPIQIKEVRKKAMEEVFAKELAEHDHDPRVKELIDKALLYMEKKCIGIPMKAAREALIK